MKFLHWLRLLVQIAILIGFQQLGEWISQLFQFPIPGSVIGLVGLFLCLKWKWIRLEWIERGASLMIGELMLFFIPAAVGVIQYKELILQSGLQMLVFIIVSTLLMMGGLGWLADRLYATKLKGEQEDD